MARSTRQLTINVNLIQCILDEPTEPITESRNIGHMHILLCEATVSSHHKRIGSIAMDPSGDVVIEMNGKRFHIVGLELWRAVYDAAHAARVLRGA